MSVDKNTVFVLGAGASYPYGYPTGAELRESLIKKPFFHDPTNKKDLTGYFRRDFKKSMMLSIDSFLAKNQNHGKMGKIGIAKFIIEKENFWFSI